MPSKRANALMEPARVIASAVLMAGNGPAWGRHKAGMGPAWRFCFMPTL
jgi:hypothetical protein